MHRWHRDYSRAARPPPDIIKDAKVLLSEWMWLFLFAIVLGTLSRIFNWTDD
jgi:hypothetical protein